MAFYEKTSVGRWVHNPASDSYKDLITGLDYPTFEAMVDARKAAIRVQDEATKQPATTVDSTNNERTANDKLTYTVEITRARFAAYEAIDTERDYQAKWNDRDEGRRSIDEFAHYINGYTADLTHITSHGRDPEAALDVVRKIAALAVACMEQHGAPRRG